MSAILFNLVAIAGPPAVTAYYVGKLNERDQIRKWLRFLHFEMKWDATPHQIDAMISANRHYNYRQSED